MENVFAEIPCLTERSVFFDGKALHKKWFKKADKRYLGEALQKFINYNAALFSFLGVTAHLEGTDNKVGLVFSSSQYVGAIPLRSPDTGKQIGDFLVVPRFLHGDKFQEYTKIFNLLEKDISPELIESLDLKSNRYFQPPLYLKALDFINALEKVVKTSWVKFDNVAKELHQPAGEVDWNQYARNSYQVEKRLQFPTRKNELNNFHQEYQQMRYVFDLCAEEILSPRTPHAIKNNFKPKLLFLKQKLYFHKPQKLQKFKIRSADSPKIKQSKLKANVILQNKFEKSTAWRLDFNEVFERFVQYIFKKMSAETGARLAVNSKIKAYSKTHLPWQLKHLEPDAIYQKANFSVVIDAKYKSNLFNRFSTSASLKENYRQDLHQLLAYSSFDETTHKTCILCYPATALELHETTFVNPFNATQTKVVILGIPLKAECVQEAKLLISKKFFRIQNKQSP